MDRNSTVAAGVRRSELRCQCDRLHLNPRVRLSRQPRKPGDGGTMNVSQWCETRLNADAACCSPVLSQPRETIGRRSDIERENPDGISPPPGFSLTPPITKGSSRCYFPKTKTATRSHGQAMTK